MQFLIPLLDFFQPNLAVSTSACCEFYVDLPTFKFGLVQLQALL